MEKIVNSPKRTTRWWNWTSDENNERILRIEGNVMRRNKLNEDGKHPWKIEVIEGETGVTTDTILG